MEQSHRRWRRGLGLLLPALLLIGLLAWGMRRHEESQAISRALARGGAPPVPNLELSTFDGRQLSLASLRGRPVVLNFWASWCVPCAEESPILQRLSREFEAKGLLVVGVDTQDLVEPAERFLARHGITYLNLRDPDGHVARMFGTTGVPETFFIAADGRVLGKFPGEQLDRRTWQEAVEALLAGRKPTPATP